MNKLFIFGGLLIAALQLTSCDNREDYFEDVNQAPHLTLSKGDSIFSSLYEDTVKLDYPILLKYQIKDEENLHLEVINNSLNEIVVTKNEITISGHILGNNEFSFFATDGFSKRHKIDVNVFVFENLDPIANFSVSQAEGTKEITIDASSSFDQDARWNGQVVNYEYKVNGNYVTNSTTLNKITYLCGTPGQKMVVVRVQDNDGAWSKEVIKNITVK